MGLRADRSTLLIVARTSCFFFAVSAFLFAQTGSFERSFNEGAAAMHSADWQAAVDAFSQATKIQPQSAEAHFNLGLAQMQLQHLPEAEAEFRDAVRLSPHMKGPHLFLGVACYRSNDFPTAIEALRRETQIDANNAKAFMWLGVAQLAAGDDPAAALTLDKAAQLNPKDVDILYHRGRAHMLVSKESYEQMYQAGPNSWRVHQALAQSFVEADKLEDAAHECQTALNMQPDEPGLHEELADIYWKQNQLDKAEAAFQDELKIDPNSISSMYKLAVVSIERSKPEVTVTLLTEVLRRAPQYRDSYYEKGRAEAQLGQLQAAIEDFKAEAAMGVHADVESRRQSYYQLAQLYRRAQQPEESKAALDMFMRLKQQDDRAQAQRLQDKLSRGAESSR